jgi:hypothetical protein
LETVINYDIENMGIVIIKNDDENLNENFMIGHDGNYNKFNGKSASNLMNKFNYNYMDLINKYGMNGLSYEEKKRCHIED